MILNAFSRRNKAIFEPIKASCEAHVSLSIQAAIAKSTDWGGGRGADNQQKHIAHILEAESPSSRCQHDDVLVRTASWVEDLNLCPATAEGAASSFIRILISFMRLHPHD